MSDFDVYCGLDVGKGEHHAVALDKSGKRLHDAPLPDDEQRLRALFDKLGRHGRVLVIVDQPATIGALPVTVARACGMEVAYLPGLAMRRIADLHPARGGNKQLKRAFFLSAFAALKDPASRAYYDRKRAEGKKHNAALICLARRRCDVIFAMLRDRKPYQPRPLPAS